MLRSAIVGGGGGLPSGLPRQLLLNLLLAGAYYLASRLGIAVAIGPSATSVVWPPSGLALAALMLGGPALVPGLAAGSLLSNASQGLPVALALAAASVAQSGVASVWLRRLPDRAGTQPLRQALRFVLVAALACCIGASVGTGLLHARGKLMAPELPFTWAVWWAGDCAGMLVLVMPALLALHPALRRQRSGAVVCAALCIGVGLSLVTAFVVGHLEREARIAQFRARSQALAAQLQGRLDLVVRDLEVLRAPFHRQPLQAPEFRTLARPLHSRSPWLLDLQWLPAGGDDAGIVYPEGAPDTLGAGMTAAAQAADARLGAALRRAYASGAIAATVPLQAGAGAPQLRLYAPVLVAAGEDLPTLARDSLRGLVAATVDLAALLQPDAAELQGLSAQLYDPAATGLRGLRLEAGVRSALTELPQPAPRSVRHLAALRVGDQEWKLLVRPQGWPPALQPSWLQAGMFCSGLAFTALLAGYLLARRGRDEALQRHRQNLSAEVAQRTRDLSLANAQLAQEVAERRRTEDELRVFRWFADSAGQGLGMADFDGHITYMNRTLSGWLADADWQPGQARRALDYYAPEAQQRLRDEVMPQVMRDGRWQGELLQKSSALHPGRLLRESIFVLKDDQGRPQCLADVVTDITDRRQMEDELRLARERAERANRAKSQFLANMSHEIRTPLNAVIGYAQLLHEEPALAAGSRDRVAAILAAGRRLLGLVNDVLDLSKIESGSVQLANDSFDLHQELRDAARVLAGRIADKGLALQLALDLPTPCLVRGDRGKLGQIVLNLLGNALKFTDSGHIRLGARREGGTLLLELQDTGPGIAQAELAALFTSFQQGAAGQLKGGTGLGLALSRNLARLMGGELTLDSQPGAGTCARLRLPLPDAEAPGAAPEADRPALPEHAQRIDPATPCHALVVEDDVDSRVILAQTLQRLGCRVSQAGDGAAGLAAARSERPTIVFTDIRMPVMDGVTLLHRLRDDPALAAVPVVAVTASSLEHERRFYTEQGFQDFVGKPYALQDIATMLHRHAALRWVAEPAAAAAQAGAGDRADGAVPGAAPGAPGAQAGSEAAAATGGRAGAGGARLPGGAVADGGVAAGAVAATPPTDPARDRALLQALVDATAAGDVRAARAALQALAVVPVPPDERQRLERAVREYDFATAGQRASALVRRLAAGDMP